MKALVLKKKKDLEIQDLPLYEKMGDHDVRIKIKNVGICGSDVHYFTNGAIGDYVVRKPMVLGHEASGVIIEVGKEVKDLKVGDRVCMEPGIPDSNSKETGLGLYNLDPKVRFWATPPIDGCLCEEVVHPDNFTFKLPDNVDFAEGAMVEPLAIGMQAATKANIKPGDVGLVFGGGTIGVMVAVCALAGGCSKVFVADINCEKLKVLRQYPNIITVDSGKENLLQKINEATDGWGADVVFEATGAAPIYKNIHKYGCPGGKIVFVGIPASGYGEINIGGLQAKEITIATIFRYAHKYERAIKLISSGDINVKPLITKVFPFKDCIKAYKLAASPDNVAVKIQIEM